MTEPAGTRDRPAGKRTLPAGAARDVRDRRGGWPAARLAAACALAAGALAALGRLVYGPGVVGYDGMYALVWGQALARGEAPELELVTAPTPHPLAIAVGAALAPLGAPAGPGALSALSFGAFGALGVAAFALGRAFGGPLVGVVLAALLLSREVVAVAALQALVDLPFLALVLAALAVVTARPPGRARVAVLVLLGLAGLLRPEGWPLALAWAVYAGRGAPARGRTWLAAGALAAPILWVLMDLALTGDPLHSLTGTRELAERLARPRGLGTAIEYAPGHLGDILGGGAAAAGIAGLALAVLRAPERAALPLAALAIGLGGFLVLGAAGLPLLIRYLLLPAAVLALFAAYALGGWAGTAAGARGGRTKTAPPRVAGAAGASGGRTKTGPPRMLWAGGAVLLAAAVLAGAPAERDAIALLREQTVERHRLERDLRALLARPAVRARIAACGPVYAPSSRPAPVVAQRLALPASRARSAAYERPRRGTFLAPAPGRERLYLLDPREPFSSARPPRGFALVARSEEWAVSARC